MRHQRPEIQEEEDSGPSKSERKREAHAAQALGEALVDLPDAELAALELPETLIDALKAARHITSRAALSRQRQYIGRLMRDLDLTPIREKLTARAEQASREAELFRRLEVWRERLITEGPQALEELERWRPGLDRKVLLPALEAARRERAAGAGVGPAGRQLFRALRALFATIPK